MPEEIYLIRSWSQLIMVTCISYCTVFHLILLTERKHSQRFQQCVRRSEAGAAVPNLGSKLLCIWAEVSAQSHRTRHPNRGVSTMAISLSLLLNRPGK